MEDFDSSDDSDDEGLHGDVDIAQIMQKSVAYSAESISALRTSQRYVAHMAEVAAAMEVPVSNVNTDASGPLTDTPEYKLIMACNGIIQDIDEDITQVHKYVAQIYCKKFPELEQLVPNKLDYLKTVERIGNETDMTVVDLKDILPSASVMVVSVTGSTTSGEALSAANLAECLRGCSEAKALVADRSTLLRFVEGRMSRIAPNLCVLIGARITAQLMGLVGGLTNLTRIPSCNVQVVGQERQRNLAGFSHVSAQLHTGILYACELVQKCPPALRKKALKVVSAKVSLAARFDSYKTSSADCSEGRRLREMIEGKIEQWQAPTRGKTKKALPVPEEKKKSRRGGKRARRFKERFAQSELSKAANKVDMSVTGGEYGDSAMGITDMASVGAKMAAESGKLRGIVRKESNLGKRTSGTNNSQQQQQKRQRLTFASGSASSSSSSSSAGTLGTASSLVFTPVQGIELVAPTAAPSAADRVKQANKNWFSATSGFASAVPR